MLTRPNAVHSAMMTSGLGTSPAIVGGVRKIPLPIVMPTMSAVPPANPMTRRRSCGGDCTEVFKEEPTYSKSRSFAPAALRMTGPLFSFYKRQAKHVILSERAARARAKDLLLGRDLLEQKPQADGAGQREPLRRSCQLAAVRIARE